MTVQFKLGDISKTWKNLNKVFDFLIIFSLLHLSGEYFFLYYSTEISTHIRAVFREKFQLQPYESKSCKLYLISRMSMPTIRLAVFFYVGDIRHWTWKFINNSLTIQRYFSHGCMTGKFHGLSCYLSFKIWCYTSTSYQWWDEINYFMLFTFSQMLWNKSSALK